MSTTNDHRLTPDKALDFIHGGKALFTLRNTKSGNRFAYKVNKSKDGNVYFVKAQNEKKMSYIGTIFNGYNFVVTKKSELPLDAPQVKGFGWLLNKLINKNLPPHAEIWHGGKCCRCGRKLIVPESIKSGYGPECIKWNRNKMQPTLFA